MMLAAIARDEAQLTAIFDVALTALDKEEGAGWSAIHLAVGRRAAEAELKRALRDQSP